MEYNLVVISSCLWSASHHSRSHLIYLSDELFARISPLLNSGYVMVNLLYMFIEFLPGLLQKRLHIHHLVAIMITHNALDTDRKLALLLQTEEFTLLPLMCRTCDIFSSYCSVKLSWKKGIEWDSVRFSATLGERRLSLWDSVRFMEISDMKLTAHWHWHWMVTCYFSQKDLLKNSFSLWLMLSKKSECS